MWPHRVSEDVQTVRDERKLQLELSDVQIIDYILAPHGPVVIACKPRRRRTDRRERKVQNNRKEKGKRTRTYQNNTAK